MQKQSALSLALLSPEIRVSCALQCTTDLGPDGLLVKLGPTSGVAYFPFISGNLPQKLCVRFMLPGGELDVSLNGEVVESDRLKDGGCSLLLDFASEDENLRSIEQFVLARLRAQMAEAVERGPTPADVTQGRVMAVDELPELRRELTRPRDTTLCDPVAGRYEKATIRWEQDGGLLVEPRGSLELKTGAWLYASWRSEGNLVQACTQIVARRTNGLLCGPPAMVCLYPASGEARQGGAPDLRVEIELPYPRGKRLIRQVVEQNDRGLAFHVGVDEPYFIPGTPLLKMALVNPAGSETLHRPGYVSEIEPKQDASGQVRHLLVRVNFDLSAQGYSKGYRGAAKKARDRRPTLLERAAFAVSELWPEVRPAEPGVLTGEPSAPTEVDVVRYMNEHRQQLAGILNMTPHDAPGALVAPVVVIPPAFGRRKESTSIVALTIVESFARAGKDVVVLRYDGIRALGESYKDPDCRDRGRENLRMTLSQAVRDIDATLDYVYNNPRFKPTKVTLLSFSLQGVVARRAVFEDRGQRIHNWLGVMCPPAVRELIRNGCGGVDYIANYAAGLRAGEVPILGIPIDCDRFCRDALDNSLAFMADAKREVAEIGIPITWLSGEHDAWVDPATVHEFLSVPAPAPRHHEMLPTGHLPLSSDDALVMSAAIVRHVSKFLFGQPIEPTPPGLRRIVRVRRSEWARRPKAPLANKRSYWQGYLLGEGDGSLGYDVLSTTEEYGEFIARQVKLLAPRRGQVIADMGCGTGNLALALMQRAGRRRFRRFERLVLVDLVEQAIEESERKLGAFFRENPRVELPSYESHCVNLELDPTVTVRRFVRGELSDLEPLKGVFGNISDYTLDLWQNNSGDLLPAVLRGADTSDLDLDSLARQLGDAELEIALDMNRVARLVRGSVSASDLAEEAHERIERGERLGLEHLRLDTLAPRESLGQERLPFDDESFDGIVSSIVLSYLNNPLETLHEFYRCLKPGGRLVVSSMLPDADMSKIYMRLLYRIESGRPVAIPKGISRARFVEEVRAYADSAAFLLNLVEEGQFSFLSRAELGELVRRAGFVRARQHLSFGSPPMAHIAVAYKPLGVLAADGGVIAGEGEP